MSESIGARLRQAREARHLSFEQVSPATHIRPHYLQALEADDYSVMPSTAQGRGFLRIYAQYLGVNLDEMLAQARLAPVEPPAPLVETPPAPQEPPHASFFAGLRDRLTRRSTGATPAPERAPSVQSAPSPSDLGPAAPAPSKVEGPVPLESQPEPTPEPPTPTTAESMVAPLPPEPAPSHQLTPQPSKPARATASARTKAAKAAAKPASSKNTQGKASKASASRAKSTGKAKSSAGDSDGSGKSKKKDETSHLIAAEAGFLSAAPSLPACASAALDCPPGQAGTGAPVPPWTALHRTQDGVRQDRQAQVSEIETALEPEPEPAAAKTPEEPQPEPATELTAESPKGEPRWRAWLSGLKSLRVSRPASALSEVGEAQEETRKGPVEGGALPLKSAPPAKPELVQPHPSSKEIFVEIGQQLRRRREMLSLTFEEIERHTRVRAVLLKGLEEGAFDQLPSPVQTRGMLANYASFLDLDVDAVLLRFADGLQARHRERHPEKPARPKGSTVVNTKVPPLRSFIAGDLIFGGGTAIVLIVFAIWGVGRILAVRAQTRPAANAPSISDVLVRTPLPTELQEVTLIPVADTPLVGALEATAETQTPNPQVNVQVNFVAVERTYMRVSVDGKVQFEGRVVPGAAYPFEAKNQIQILVGNAAALRVTYNGRDLGLMGNFGEVADLVYTAGGVATPTSTPLPTPTFTPYLTPTPSPTPTRTETPTSTARPGE